MRTGGAPRDWGWWEDSAISEASYRAAYFQFGQLSWNEAYGIGAGPPHQDQDRQRRRSPGADAGEQSPQGKYRRKIMTGRSASRRRDRRGRVLALWHDGNPVSGCASSTRREARNEPRARCGPGSHARARTAAGPYRCGDLMKAIGFLRSSSGQGERKARLAFEISARHDGPLPFLHILSPGPHEQLTDAAG